MILLGMVFIPLNLAVPMILISSDLGPNTSRIYLSCVSLMFFWIGNICNVSFISSCFLVLFEINNSWKSATESFFNFFTSRKDPQFILFILFTSQIITNVTDQVKYMYLMNFLWLFTITLVLYLTWIKPKNIIAQIKCNTFSLLKHKVLIIWAHIRRLLQIIFFKCETFVQFF